MVNRNIYFPLTPAAKLQMLPNAEVFQLFLKYYYVNGYCQFFNIKSKLFESYDLRYIRLVLV